MERRDTGKKADLHEVIRGKVEGKGAQEMVFEGVWEQGSGPGS